MLIIYTEVLATMKLYSGRPSYEAASIEDNLISVTVNFQGRIGLKHMT